MSGYYACPFCETDMVIWQIHLRLLWVCECCHYEEWVADDLPVPP